MKKDPGAKAGRKHGVRRANKWVSVRRAYLKVHPACELCGCLQKVEVHHKMPFHVSAHIGRPDLELDLRNLITLCSDAPHEHHVLLGHLGDYQSYLRSIPWGARRLGRLRKAEIMSDPAWRRRVSRRPKDVGKLTADATAELRRWTDRRYPKR